METGIYLQNNNSPPPSLPKKWTGSGVLGSVEEDESPPPPGDRGRRKSWHFTKEKEPKLPKRATRRKGSLLPPTSEKPREKRPSWWNILLPENMGGSRYAEQDHGIGDGFNATNPLPIRITNRTVS
ncbi:LysM [Nesidiocoris tenuis]|uniref:LysM n=1 Tax=Nesidiocoris tenuis TaxID=355587 RepID=A0ABN7B5I4_9HEMI|nr:LysM [Nesidiocoris tenuis]